MKVHEIVTEADQGRRNFMRGVAAGAGALGAAGLGYKMFSSPPLTTRLHPSKIENTPMVTQEVETPETRRRTLKHIALNNGISGEELNHLIAQAAHETLDFKRMEESGDMNWFMRYDPSSPNPQHRATAKKLGNVNRGDGIIYRGRGYVMLTGRDNYRRVGQALNMPLEQEPEIAAMPQNAALIAVWWWLNKVQPRLKTIDTKSVTRQINPGASPRDINKREVKYQQLARDNI